MNVFVLSTGRCGSTTFAKACHKMTNYTAAHESKRREHDPRDSVRYRSLAYPASHIEIDNRLSWFLGGLDETYGAEAFYVHLLRDQDAVATSYARRWENKNANIILPFAWGIQTHPYDHAIKMREQARFEIARHYWETVNSNIRQFLKDKPHQMTMWLDDIKPGFEEFWHHIGAKGDLNAALQVWDNVYNPSVTNESQDGA